MIREFIKDTKFLFQLYIISMMVKTIPIVAATVIVYKHGILPGILWFIFLFLTFRLFRQTTEPGIIAKMAKAEGVPVPTSPIEQIELYKAHTNRMIRKYHD